MGQENLSIGRSLYEPLSWKPLSGKGTLISTNAMESLLQTNHESAKGRKHEESAEDVSPFYDRATESHCPFPFVIPAG
jgi:hypothetical protein